MEPPAFSYAYNEVPIPLTFRCIHNGMLVSFVQHAEFSLTSNYYYRTLTLHFPFLCALTKKCDVLTL